METAQRALEGKERGCHGIKNLVNFGNLGDFSYLLDLSSLCFPIATGNEVPEKPRRWLQKCYLKM